MVAPAGLRLTVAMQAYTTAATASMFTPTAAAGAKVSMGSGSCTEHADAGSLTARLFVPDGWDDWEEELGIFARTDLGWADRMVFSGELTTAATSERPGTPAPLLDLAAWSYEVSTDNGATWTTPATAVDAQGRLVWTGASTGVLYSFRATSPWMPAPTRPEAAAEGWFDQPGATLTIEHRGPAGPGTAAGALWTNPFYGADGYTTSYRGVPTAPAARVELPAGSEARLVLTGKRFISAVADGRLPLLYRAGLWDARTRGTVSGTWYDIAATDVIAARARARIGDDPWPAETAQQRAARINSLTGMSGFLQLAAGTTEPVGPRDVDSRSPVEIAQLTVAATGQVLRSRPSPGNLATTSATFHHPLELRLVSGTAALVPAADLFTVPAGAIRRDLISQDANALASTVRLGWRGPATADDPFGTDETATVFSTYIARGADTVRTLKTDAATTSGAAGIWAQNIANAQALPLWFLDSPAKLIPRLIPTVPATQDLLRPYEMWGRCIELADAPRRISPYQRIRGASVTFAGTDTAVELDLEPAQYSAPAGVSAGDLKATGRTNILLQHLGAITADDLKKTS